MLFRSIASTILRNEELYGLWESEVKHMADRIIEMRERLYDNLVAQKTPGEWSHIKKQIGMFRCVQSCCRGRRAWGIADFSRCMQLHGPDAAADSGAGGEGAHLHDGGRADLDGGPEREQHRLLLGEREQGRQGRSVRSVRAAGWPGSRCGRGLLIDDCAP